MVFGGRGLRDSVKNSDVVRSVHGVGVTGGGGLQWWSGYVGRSFVCFSKKGSFSCFRMDGGWWGVNSVVWVRRGVYYVLGVTYEFRVVWGGCGYF